MSDGREEREELERRRKWSEQEHEGKRPMDRPFREREWEERGREPS